LRYPSFQADLVLKWNSGGQYNPQITTFLDPNPVLEIIGKTSSTVMRDSTPVCTGQVYSKKRFPHQ